MKKGKKKLYVILIICIVFLGVIASSICIRKNSTKNILIENLINKVQKKETFDRELLKNYNNKKALHQNVFLTFKTTILFEIKEPF